MLLASASSVSVMYDFTFTWKHKAAMDFLILPSFLPPLFFFLWKWSIWVTLIINRELIIQKLWQVHLILLIVHLIITGWLLPVFPTSKKKGRKLNHKMGHCICTKGAIFSEKEHFSFAIKELAHTNWAF